MAKEKETEQWLLEAYYKGLLKPELKKDKFLPDYVNSANLILYRIQKAGTAGILLKELKIATGLHANTVAVYGRILNKLELISAKKDGSKTLYLWREKKDDGEKI